MATPPRDCALSASRLLRSSHSGALPTSQVRPSHPSPSPSPSPSSGPAWPELPLGQPSQAPPPSPQPPFSPHPHSKTLRPSTPPPQLPLRNHPLPGPLLCSV
uniref:Uncharacterized protein n=1 Tax=Ananas comosus var. bracteatus TaxID=296719 RepID=A0A6V7QLB9_ANACO|nr:unnamed protein product [Ananas comosus var. bracteatus]